MMSSLGNLLDSEKGLVELLCLPIARSREVFVPPRQAYPCALVTHAVFVDVVRLRRMQLGGDVGKEPLVGIGTRQQEAYTAAVASDHGTDLE